MVAVGDRGKRNWRVFGQGALAVLLLLAVLAACGQFSSQTVPPQDPLLQEGHVIRMGFSQVETDNPWRTAQLNSFRDAALAVDLELLYHEPEEYTVEWQINDIYQLIAEGADYLVIAPKELAPLLECLKAAKEAQVPVILIHQTGEGVPREYYTSLIFADYVKEGELCARMLAEAYQGKTCNIVEIRGFANSPMAKARSLGFRKELSQYPNLNVVYTENGNFNRVTAQKAMENVLIKSQGSVSINAVFAHSDEDGLGALHAIKAAGRDPDEFSIVSINGIQDVCKAIIADEYLGTVESNPRWGPIAVTLIRQMERNATPFPNVVIPYRIINKENVLERFSSAY
ncbi:MAG: substrate-binding domain-containing protein [Lachnospiraceae bacterium]|nr:substrate-binding domain-containing protein [Lachnospiraceae bacterium]